MLVLGLPFARPEPKTKDASRVAEYVRDCGLLGKLLERAGKDEPMSRPRYRFHDLLASELAREPFGVLSLVVFSCALGPWWQDAGGKGVLVVVVGALLTMLAAWTWWRIGETYRKGLSRMDQVNRTTVASRDP